MSALKSIVKTGYPVAGLGPDFLWGVSVAAAQIEGAARADGRGPSIWDTFSDKKGKIYHGHHPGISCDFYHRWMEDVALMKALSIPHFRFSLSWSRILPEGVGHINQKGLDFYKRLIDKLLEEGILPWITLYHWDLPQALEDRGGWTNRDILHWFTEFGEIVSRELTHRGVQYWMVLNEPMVFTGAGYFLGYHAPGKRGFSHFIPAMLHAALATSIGVEILKSSENQIQVGSTYSCSLIHPKTQSEADMRAAHRADALLNRLFIEPAMGLGFPLQDLPVLNTVEKYMRPNDDNRLRASLDFIGIQNYTREIVASSWYVPYVKAKLINAKKRGVPHTEMQWEIYPDALLEMLRKFSKYQPGLPLIVTENGAAFPDIWKGEEILQDSHRVTYLQDHVERIVIARSEGIPVNGYFVWTWMDNFEWAEGYRPRFGLVYVDFGTRKRILKQSALWFSQCIQAWREDVVATELPMEPNPLV